MGIWCTKRNPTLTSVSEDIVWMAQCGLICVDFNPPAPELFCVEVSVRSDAEDDAEILQETRGAGNDNRQVLHPEPK